MKDRRLEALIIASCDKSARSNAAFTDSVMKKVTAGEISSPLVRTMSTNKKESFFMKLSHLPKFAIVAIALGSLVVLSGTAYAAYKLLWEQPSVSVSQPETSASGREQVSLLFSRCGKDDMPAKYELKKGAPISADQIATVVTAQCELKAINDWAMATYAQGEGGSFGDPRTHEMPMVSLALQIQTVDPGSVTFAQLEGYGYPAETFETSKEVRYIADGQEVERSSFKPNDIVAYVALSKTVQTPMDQCTTDACREFGEYRGVQRIVALVKLDKPLQDYDQRAWQSLTELSPCMGNPLEYCLGGYSGSIDVYMGDFQNSAPGSDNQVITKQIEGTVTQINGATFTIRATSGALYTINTPLDVIQDFNTNKSVHYNNEKIAIGTTLSITYWEDQGASTKTVPGGTIQRIDFKIEIVSKGDQFRQY